MSETFDPERVDRWDARDEHVSGDGEFVLYEDYQKLMVLLHDVATEADPAGTLRENIVLKETVKALETENEELKAEIERLKGDK
jgi:hypothetical protein